MNNQRIIEKIKKLFALAANEDSEGNEAENALRMANKLLEKHSIDKLNLADSDAVSCTFITEQDKKWVRIVFTSITKLYNCRMFIDLNWDKPKFVIVGTESNRTTAQIVIEQLLDQIRSDSKGKKDDFRLGAANSLYWMCDEIVNERKVATEEIAPGTGLIPLDVIKSNDIKNEDWISDNVGMLGTIKQGRSKVSQEGLDYGRCLNPGARVSKAQAISRGKRG